MPASLRLRARRKVRRTVATQVRAVTDRLPGDGVPGPGPLRPLAARALVAEARVALRSRRDADDATALLDRVLAEPALPDAVAGEAWAVLAEVRRTSGDPVGARAAADTAVALAPGSFAVLLERHKVVASDESLQALLTREPRSRTEARGAIEVLRTGTRADVTAYGDRLRGWGRHGHEVALVEIGQEVLLIGASDDELDGVLDHLAGHVGRAVLVATRALTRRGEWERLAAYVDAHRPRDLTGAEASTLGLEVRRAAGLALKAGRARAARDLAAHALALTPDDLWARETWTAARDTVEVATDGWAFAPVRPVPRIAPRPGAVLSVLAQSMPHTSGGYATRTHGVLTGLTARGWDVAGVTRPGFPYDRWSTSDDRIVDPVDHVDGIAYHRLLTRARKYPQAPLRTYVDRYADHLERLVREHRPAVVHASSFHVNGLAAQQAAARLGVPFVYEMRGLEELMKVSRDPSFETTDRHAFTAGLETGIAVHADRTFVITEALRDLMVERGVPAERLVVLPNGVHADRFEPRPRDAELAVRLGIGDRVVVGYAGGLVDYEGLDLLLHAVAELRRHRDDLHLLVVGDGPEEGRLHALAESLGLGGVGGAGGVGGVGGAVTFTGRVPHDEVASYLSLVDVAPFPRLPLPVCEAISPIKPFESMAMGKAVVVSSVAALTEIVRDGETGLVFRKGDAADLARTLGRLADDAGLRRRLGGEARAWVRAERDWSRIVRIVETVYDELGAGVPVARPA